MWWRDKNGFLIKHHRGIGVSTTLRGPILLKSMSLTMLCPLFAAPYEDDLHMSCHSFGGKVGHLPGCSVLLILMSGKESLRAWSPIWLLSSLLSISLIRDAIPFKLEKIAIQFRHM